MKQLLIVIMLLFLYNPSSSAQGLGGLLGKVGVSNAKPQNQYVFNGNIVQRITMIDTKRDTLWIESTYYYGKDPSYIGNKIANTNNDAMKKNLNMLSFTIFDLTNLTGYSFLETNGQKVGVAIRIKEDDIEETIGQDADKITITKTNKTRTIMNITCEGYQVIYPKENNSIMLWVPVEPVPVLVQLGKGMAKSYNAVNNSKQKNYLSYATHPTFIKLANEGRGIAGFTAVTKEGAITDMEILKVNPSEELIFQTQGYQFMF